MKAWLEDHGKDFGLFIDGKWVKPDGRKKYLTKNPATGKALKLNTVLWEDVCTKGRKFIQHIKGRKFIQRTIVYLHTKLNPKCCFTNYQDITRTQFKF